jgi:hypothetical protein
VLEDHTVRISTDNLDMLKEYKDMWSLSYNDIIGMGLKMLKGNDVQQVAVEAPVYKIKVSLNRVKINDSVKRLLLSGYDLFIPDITHRQAMYVKRKLKSMGFACDYIKSEGDGQHGFLFMQPSEPKPRVLIQPTAQAKPQPVIIH